MLGIEWQRKLEGRVVLEAGERKPDESQALRLDHRRSRREQPSRGVEDRLGVRCGLWQGVRAGRPREVGEAQPEDDRTADSASRTQPASEAIDEGDDDRVDVLARSPPATERALPSDRPPTPTDMHGPVSYTHLTLPTKRIV